MKTINKIAMVAVGLTSLTLVGCASTTIYPTGKNTYSLVATSSSEGTAEKAAEAKASKMCQQMGKAFVVTSHNSVYQGADKTAAAFVNLAGDLTGNIDPAATNDDYKVTLNFQCQ